MYKKNKIAKIKNPTQINVRKYPNEMDIDIFEVCGRGGDFKNINHMGIAYCSSNRQKLFVALVITINPGLRICLKKLK